MTMIVGDLVIRDNASAGIASATANMEKLATAADKVSSATTKIEQSTSAALPTLAATSRKYDEQVQLLGRIEKANRTYAQALASMRASTDSSAEGLANLAKLEQNAAADRDISIKRATDFAARIKDTRDAIINQTAATDTNRQSLDAHTDSTSKNAFAQRQLGIQASQAVSGLLTGQGVFQVLIQQGHQVGDTMLSMGQGFSGLGIAAKGLFNTLGGWPVVALAAVGTAIFTIASHAAELDAENRTLSASIAGVGDHAATTTAQLAGYANQLRQNTDLTQAQAIAAVAAIQRTPNLTTSDKQAIVSLAPDVSAALGNGAEDTIKSLTSAYAGNFAAIKTLMAATNEFSLAQVTQVRQLLEVGDKEGALQIITDKLSTSYKNLSKDSTPALTLAMRDLSAGWKSFIDGLATSDLFTHILEGYAWGFQRLGNAMKDAAGVTGIQVSPAMQVRLDAAAEAKKIQVQIDAINNGTNLTGEMGQPVFNTQRTKDSEIAALRLQLADASKRMLPANPSGTSLGSDSSGKVRNPELGGATGFSPIVRTTEQSQAVDDYNKKLDEQNRILATSLPLRAATAAAQQAYDQAIASGLGIDDAKALKTKTMATALAQAGDAAVLEAAATDRATGYAVKMTSAIEQGSVAALQATAAAEAHEKATTQAGVSEAAYTKTILTRNAAQSIQKGAQDVSDLKLQVDLSQKVLNATTSTAAHEQDLANKVTLTTKAMTDAAAASGNPALIASAQAKVDQEIKLGLQLDANNAKLANRNLIEDTDRQTAAQQRISAAWDGSAASLSHLQDLEKARSIAFVEFAGKTGPEYEARVDAITKSFDRSSESLASFQQQQASVQAISQAFSQAFSTIGNAITQAFVSGQGAAVNWGNVVKAVLSQVIQQIAQLAILNPVLNSLFGQQNGTLGTGLQTLFGGGGGSPQQTTTTKDAAGNIISTSTSVVGGASTLSGAFGGPTLGSTLGLTGEGGLLTGLGSVPLFSGGASLAGAGAAPGLIAGGANGLIAEGAISSIGEAAPVTLNSLAATTIGGASLGSFAGGAGLGIAGGTIAGGLVSGALNKDPTGSKIGTAVGTAAGLAIGTIILPGIGTILGGLIGGTLGGAGGGLIGPHVASIFSTTDLTVNKGQIEAGKTIQQGVDAYPQLKAVVAQIDALQSFESQHNIATTGQSGRIQIGVNNPHGFLEPTKFDDLDTPNVTGRSAFSLLSFGSQNPIENDKISKKTFANSTELSNWVTSFEAAQTATKNIISGTTNLAGQFGTTVGSVNTSLAAVNAQFDGADVTIKALLATEYLSAQQTTDLTKAEGDLNTLRAKSIAQINDAANAQVDAANQTLMGRFLTAKAVNDNSPAEAQTAQLYNFDVQATAQRLAYKNNLVSLFGDSFLATQAFADDSALQEKALGAERLSIQKSYNDQIAQANGTARANDLAAHAKALTDAGSNVVSLSQYLQKLQTGSDSPLSAQDQLALAQRTFATDTSRIKAGDLSGLPSLQTDSDTLLAASRAINGSGTGFVADFNKVVDVISSIANMPIDVLTGAIFRAETKTQTAVLSDGLTDLKASVEALRLELRQVSTTPAQVGKAA